MSDIVVLFMTIAIILAVINLIYVAGSFFFDRRVKDKSKDEEDAADATPVTDAPTGFSGRSVIGNDKLIINISNRHRDFKPGEVITVTKGEIAESFGRINVLSDEVLDTPVTEETRRFVVRAVKTVDVSRGALVVQNG